MTSRYGLLFVHVAGTLLTIHSASLVPSTAQTSAFFGEQLDANAEVKSKTEKGYSEQRWIASTLAEPSGEASNHLEPRFLPTGGKKVLKSSVSSNPPLALAQRDDSVSAALVESLPTTSIEEVFCDFGPLPGQSLCEWQDGCGGLKWTAGTGLGANWLGGPTTDATSGTMEGGYAFLETSQLPGKLTTAAVVPVDGPGANGFLHSPQLGSTGAGGTCFMFKYAMDGLSPAGLRVLLHAGYDEFSSTVTKANETRPGTMSCDRPAKSTSSADVQQDDHVLWHAHYHILGIWQQAQILYTFPDVHTLIFEGIPVEASDPSRSYSGYIAVDDFDLQPGSACLNFCNFAGGFCDWTNEEDDDFDWSISRGSNKPTTGPVMDRDASLSSGGYAYIDSSFPRRPGDVARLVSSGLPASALDAPMCMHFSFHMFGSGIGELRLSLRPVRNLDAQLQEIWRLKGNAGNSWFDSRVTVSSLEDFQLVFEATVGNTAMGDIAIDNIAFTIGACPTSPQVAAPPNYPRDCTFEIDECDWINSREPSAPSSGVSVNLPSRGRMDWERVSQKTLNARNHRKPYSLAATRPRQDYFMTLQSRGVAPAVTGTAYLLSSEIKATGEPICLTFWYLMFESFIDATGPSLGVLRVLVHPTSENFDAALPVWQLYNNQGPTWNYAQANIIEKRDFNLVFEGTWGPNRANGNIAIDDIAFYTGNCSVRPNSAMTRAEDCSFEKGLCGWENMTNSGVNDPRVQWQRAFPNHRPAQLLDKTFGSSGDFVFFDIFSPSQKREVKLRSPLIGASPDEEATCFTFWFVAFGVEESTSLRIVKVSANQEANGSPEASQDDEGADQELLWSLTAKGFNNPRPSWTWAQVTIENRASYRLILEGSASNGGFAIDDIKFQPQACPTRPEVAKPSTSSQEL